MSADDPTPTFDLDNLEDHIFSDGLENFEERVVRVRARDRDQQGKRVAVFCMGWSPSCT